MVWFSSHNLWAEKAVSIDPPFQITISSNVCTKKMSPFQLSFITPSTWVLDPGDASIHVGHFAIFYGMQSWSPTKFFSYGFGLPVLSVLVFRRNGNSVRISASNGTEWQNLLFYEYIILLDVNNSSKSLENISVDIEMLADFPFSSKIRLIWLALLPFDSTNYPTRETCMM